MILPDSSIWVDHFRRANTFLAEWLESDQTLCHPFIVGELACGQLSTRASTIKMLQTLPEAPLMQHNEVLTLLERYRLMASGIGWVDAHLLGSALLAQAEIWTLDQSLARAARKLGVAANPQLPDKK
jgi:predicted nucleic acid-binding protein